MARKRAEVSRMKAKSGCPLAMLSPKPWIILSGIEHSHSFSCAFSLDIFK